jgi:hypothetical protein
MISGLTRARFPARDTMVIAVRAAVDVDGARLRAVARRRAVVRSLMPGVRSVIEAYLGFLNRDGLVQIPVGWNLRRLGARLGSGMPPGAGRRRQRGAELAVRWACRAAELERGSGEPEFRRPRPPPCRHARRPRRGGVLGRARGRVRRRTGGRTFCEHASAWPSTPSLAYRRSSFSRAALLDDGAHGARDRLVRPLPVRDLPTIGRVDRLFDRLAPWHCSAALGLLYRAETPEPSRSIATAGARNPASTCWPQRSVRPASPGFGSVRIGPQLARCQASGRVVRGLIDVAFTRTADNMIEASVTCPPT